MIEKKSMVGEKNYNSKLSEQDVLNILKQKGSIKQVEIARMYGVTKSTIYKIWTGQRWGHIKVVDKNNDEGNK